MKNLKRLLYIFAAAFISFQCLNAERVFFKLGPGAPGLGVYVNINRGDSDFLIKQKIREAIINEYGIYDFDFYMPVIAQDDWDWIITGYYPYFIGWSGYYYGGRGRRHHYHGKAHHKYRSSPRRDLSKRSTKRPNVRSSGTRKSRGYKVQTGGGRRSGGHSSGHSRGRRR